VTGRPRAEIRKLTPDDDLEPLLDLARRSFGPFGEAAREHRLADARESIAAGRHLGAFDGGRLLGAAKFFDLAQWWHGRSLRTAGVANVVVAPEERGRGTGRALMDALVTEMGAQGYPLSVLYPATATVYRRVGYELAGAQYQVSMPARSLRSLLPPDVPDVSVSPAGPALSALRRVGPDDAAEIDAVVARVHELACACGPVTFDVEVSRRQLDDEDLFCYLADDGFLAYTWTGGHSGIQIYNLVAGSAATARALWSVIASHDSMAGTVRAFVGPADPVSWLTAEPDVSLARRYPWMLRVVDAEAAIAGRGFPPAAEAAVTLRLGDELCPANAGLWKLEVSGGKGALQRPGTDPAPAGPVTSGGATSGSPTPGAATPGPLAPGPLTPGPLTLGARGFAALYAGTPVATLRVAGLAAGGDLADDAALDGAFTAAAFMLDYF
jgi:predicted N-acetyltransferase YhbS